MYRIERIARHDGTVDRVRGFDSNQVQDSQGITRMHRAVYKTVSIGRQKLQKVFDATSVIDKLCEFTID